MITYFDFRMQNVIYNAKDANFTRRQLQLIVRGYSLMSV